MNSIFNTYLFSLMNMFAILIIGSQVTLNAETFIVAESGGDYSSIQEALNNSTAGDSILVKEKSSPYPEKIEFPVSGNSDNGFIVLMAFPGDNPIIDGTGVGGENIFLISNRSYIKIIGFEIRNNLDVSDGSGVRIIGAGSFLEIRNNIIHDIRGSNAMGITVYGTESTPISNLIIDSNEIYDCEPAQSEALVLNGNITGFEVTNNLVRDVNNIGIDFIGGESWVNDDPTLVARNGICSGNQVYNANSSYGGGYAGGIYVDGGKDIMIENNIVSGCDLGIEIGAENSGTIVSGIIVRNNVVFGNEKVGIIFGGYAMNTGRVNNCYFLNNTCYKNDILYEGWGELAIQYAEDNTIENNIFYCNSQNVLLYSENGNVNNQLNYNLWYNENGTNNSTFVWRGTSYESFSDYQTGSEQDVNSQFEDPQFLNPSQDDYHIQTLSPAIDKGNPLFVPAIGEVDIDGEPRIYGSQVDVGADEWHSSSSMDVNIKKFFSYDLEQNYPNPFNPKTIINYELQTTNYIELTIFNSLGEKVTTLVSEKQEAGFHKVEWNATEFAGGIYFYRLKVGNFSDIKKMVVVK